MTPRELGAAARGHRMAERAYVTHTRLAMWGEEAALRQFFGGEGAPPRMTEADYMLLKRQLGEA